MFWTPPTVSRPARCRERPGAAKTVAAENIAGGLVVWDDAKEEDGYVEDVLWGEEVMGYDGRDSSREDINRP